MRGLEPRSGRRPYLHASKRTRGALLTPSRTKDPWKRGTKVCQDTRSISLNSRHATSVISRGFHSLRLKQSNISYSSTYSFRGSRSTRDVRHFRWILNKRGMGEGTFLRLKSIEYLRYIWMYSFQDYRGKQDKREEESRRSARARWGRDGKENCEGWPETRLYRQRENDGSGNCFSLGRWRVTGRWPARAHGKTSKQADMIPLQAPPTERGVPRWASPAPNS